jgi:hypothetical protein
MLVQIKTECRFAVQSQGQDPKTKTSRISLLHYEWVPGGEQISAAAAAAAATNPALKFR